MEASSSARIRQPSDLSLLRFRERRERGRSGHGDLPALDCLHHLRSTSGLDLASELYRILRHVQHFRGSVLSNCRNFGSFGRPMVWQIRQPRGDHRTLARVKVAATKVLRRIESDSA